MALTISFVRHQSHCEHCGTPITNCYIVRDPESGFQIRVGSTCIHLFTKLTQSSIKYVVNELKKAQKILDHKERIEAAVQAQDEELIKAEMTDIYWQENYSNVEEAAAVWCDILQRRFDSRVEMLNQRLAKNTVRNTELMK